MANQIHNANMTFGEIFEEAKPAKVTPIHCGRPTPEEEAQAFEEVLRDMRWRNNR